MRTANHTPPSRANSHSSQRTPRLVSGDNPHQSSGLLQGSRVAGAQAHPGRARYNAGSHNSPRIDPKAPLARKPTLLCRAGLPQGYEDAVDGSR
jgi:hypothetical protein